MKILIFSQYFFPENLPINFIATKLTSSGNEVDVCTGIPNYPEGKFFDGYSNKFKIEYFGKIKIYRCPVIPRGNSKFNLFLNYISFLITASFKAISLKKVDIVLAMSYSPIISVIPSFFIKASKKFIWVQDLWPESLKATNTLNNSFLLEIINKMVSLIYTKFNKILIQSKSFEEYISSNQKVPKNKFNYLPNHFEDLFQNDFPPKIPDEILKIKSPKILFAGNIGYAQNLSITLKADSILNKEGVHVSWIFLGKGRFFDEFKKNINESKKNNFHLLGSFPLERMNDFFYHSDALYVSLNDKPIFSYTIPNKIQSYLAAGKPIIASLNGAGKEIIEISNSGFASSANSHIELASNIIKFIQLNKASKAELGQNGRHYFLKNFTRKAVINKFLHIVN